LPQAEMPARKLRMGRCGEHQRPVLVFVQLKQKVEGVSSGKGTWGTLVALHNTKIHTLKVSARQRVSGFLFERQARQIAD
jgi:hypothetical protein